MIQRIQTVYLILAIAFGCIALCMPLVHFVQTDPSAFLSLSAIGYGEIGTTSGLDVPRYLPLVLAVLAVASIVLSCVAIFKYKARKIQARYCSAAICLMLLFAIVVGGAGYMILAANSSLTAQPTLYAIAPLLTLCMQIMARRGVIKDEKLVQASNRIR